MLRLVLLASLLAALPARAEENPHLAKAREQIAALKHLSARDTLLEALRFGKNGPAELAEIYRLAGEVEAAVGKPGPAEIFFQHCLAIDPQAHLAPGVAPKISRPFESAKAFFAGKEPLRAHHEVVSGPEPRIVVVVDSDPLSMVKGARAILYSGASQATVEGEGDRRIELALPKGSRLEVVVSVVDGDGNRLVELGSREAPIVIEPTPPAPAPVPAPVPAPAPAAAPAPVPAPAPESPSLIGRWWLWGTGAVVFAAGGAGFVVLARRDARDLQALNDDSVNHSYDEARELEDRARQRLLVGNIAFGGAAALGVVAGILLMRDLLRHDDPAVAAVPAPGGALVTFTRRF